MLTLVEGNWASVMNLLCGRDAGTVGVVYLSRISPKSSLLYNCSLDGKLTKGADSNDYV